MLAAALEANDRLARLAEELREENARLRAENAEQAAELERVRADLAVLQRMLFGRSSEQSRPGRGAGGAGGGAQEQDRGSGAGGKRGPGARAGRRDYSHLPRFKVVWDFPGGGYCCPQCGAPFTGLGSDHVAEQLDWLVIVRVRADCRRRYRRACSCRVPAAVTAPGPPKAIGKGLFSNGFIAMVFTERYVGGAEHELAGDGAGQAGGGGFAGHAGGGLRAGRGAAGAAGGGHHGAVAGVVAPARGRNDVAGLRPARGRRPGEMVAVGVPRPGHRLLRHGPQPRSGAVLARHAGIDEETGQLTADGDEGPRRLVISSDFYAVYQSAGKKADGLVNLYCWAHIRRYFVRAGDANPAQLAHWTAAWLDRIKALYAAHAQLMAAWEDAAAPAPRECAAAAARLEEAGTAWDEAIAVIDEVRRKQMTAPGLQEPAKKALATLDREWDGLIAHRGYPMIGLDNNPAERAIRRPVVTRKNAGGSRNEDAARLAARTWTVTATAEMAGLNLLTYLTAYLDACGRNGGKPLTGADLERFLPWNAAPEDLRAWAQPPAPG